MRRAACRDSTEADIIDALRKVGALVETLDKWDLQVFYRGRLFMLDAKTPHGKARRFKTQSSQERLVREGWPLIFVRDAEEALRAIGAIASHTPTP